jgi:DDE superfamily endonuclease
VKEAVPAAHRDKPLEIWFQDEARIGQKGTLTRVWARIGSRPRAPRDSRYEWAYIFGAICPERATGVGLVLSYANCEAMNLHLAEIGRAVRPGAHGVLVLDGAGWHTAPPSPCPTTSPWSACPPARPNSIPPKTSGITCARTSSPGSPPSPRATGLPYDQFCRLV